MMTDAQAFNHLLETANGFANKINATITRTNNLKEFMSSVAMNITALAAVAHVGSPVTTAEVIVGLTLLLRRPDDINKITLVNATNVKDVKDE